MQNYVILGKNVSGIGLIRSLVLIIQVIRVCIKLT